jgi:transcriptional regulator with XRE-family HTH domain
LTYAELAFILHAYVTALTTYKEGYLMHGSLALKLRVLRAQKALTIEQAAELAGVTPETISDAERGRRHPYVPTLRKLAKAYGVPVEELLEAEGAEVPLADAPQAGPAREQALAELEDAAAELAPFPDVLKLSEKELEDIRVRAREYRAEFKALRDAQYAALEDLRVARAASEAGEPPEDLEKVEQRDRIMYKLWKVVWFERNRAAINADTRRKPEAPIYADTTGLSLGDAYKVWRGERIPASLGVR